MVVDDDLSLESVMRVMVFEGEKKILEEVLEDLQGLAVYVARIYSAGVFIYLFIFSI